ncbi:acyltransferase [Rhodopseudomonas palustris]|uniref:Acyltransferase n=1 Tax=Rhodopseudomonas palustris TaxID=1076 RepID=A0A418UX94_RHOPL|nr:acyltransferase [Rhodopseudomonas palustris]RJF65256.1 acyltransferase [Rhodopseudomonas palustris]
MRGKLRILSLRRRLISDLMRASRDVPLITYQRSLNLTPLALARGRLATPPGFAAIIAKAWALVAREQPMLRTLVVDFPFPHVYELPRSVAMIAIARTVEGEDCVLMQKVVGADELSLRCVDALIREAQTAPICEVPMFRKLLRISALPWPLRRIVWWGGMALARQRANFFGSVGLSSVSALGAGDLYPISPGPYMLSYGRLHDDGRFDMVIRFDHRLIDAAPIARAMTRLEQVLNTSIAGELQAMYCAATDLPPVRAIGA